MKKCTSGQGTSLKKLTPHIACCSSSKSVSKDSNLSENLKKKSRLPIKIRIQSPRLKKSKKFLDASEEKTNPVESPSHKRIRSEEKPWRTSLEELREAKTKVCSGINHAIGSFSKKTIKLAGSLTKTSYKSPKKEFNVPVNLENNVTCDKLPINASNVCNSSLKTEVQLEVNAKSSDENVLRRHVKGRACGNNAISDCTLYGTDHVQTVLKVLRSNLGAEEKLTAIKYSHDYWEKLEKGELSVKDHPFSLEQIFVEKKKSSIKFSRSKTSPCLNKKLPNNLAQPLVDDMKVSDSCKQNNPLEIEHVDLNNENSQPKVLNEAAKSKRIDVAKLKLDLPPSSTRLKNPLLKSPVSIQEWVDSIAVNDEGKESEDVVSSQNARCLPHPQKIPSYDEDEFSLGAEAKLLRHNSSETSNHLHPHSADADSSNQFSRNNKRVPLSQVNKQCSFNSEFSSYSAISHFSTVSSVEALLNMRKEDPEEILRNLGFCGPIEVDSFSRIPQRFLTQPSMAKGLVYNSPMSQSLQVGKYDMVNANVHNVQGTVNASFSRQSPVQTIIRRMSSNGSLLQQKSSNMSMISESSDVAEILNHRNMKQQISNADSILNPANRKFLDSQNKAPDAPMSKRLVLGSQMFSVSTDGELVFEEKDKGQEKMVLKANAKNQSHFNSYRPLTLSTIGRQRRFSSCENLYSPINDVNTGSAPKKISSLLKNSRSTKSIDSVSSFKFDDGVSEIPFLDYTAKAQTSNKLSEDSKDNSIPSILIQTNEDDGKNSNNYAVGNTSWVSENYGIQSEINPSSKTRQQIPSREDDQSSKLEDSSESNGTSKEQEIFDNSSCVSDSNTIVNKLDSSLFLKDDSENTPVSPPITESCMEIKINRNLLEACDCHKDSIESFKSLGFEEAVTNFIEVDEPSNVDKDASYHVEKECGNYLESQIEVDKRNPTTKSINVCKNPNIVNIYRNSLSSVLSSDSNNESIDASKYFRVRKLVHPKFLRRISQARRFESSLQTSSESDLSSMQPDLFFNSSDLSGKNDKLERPKSLCRGLGDNYNSYKSLVELIKNTKKDQGDIDEIVSEFNFSEEDYHAVTNFQRLLHETDVLCRAIKCYKEDFQRVESSSLHRYRKVYAELPSEYKVEISAIQDIRQSISKEIVSIQKLLVGRYDRLIKNRGPIDEIAVRSTDLIHDMTMLLRQQKEICDELEKLEYSMIADSTTMFYPSQLTTLRDSIISKQDVAYQEIYSSLEQMKCEIIEEVKKTVSVSILKAINKS